MCWIFISVDITLISINLICFGYLSTLYVLDIYQHRYVWIFISVDTIPIYFHEYIWTFISGCDSAFYFQIEFGLYLFP